MRFSVLKNLLPDSAFRLSSILGSGYASYCVTAFSHLWSTQKRQFPSFFITRTTGELQAPLVGYLNHFSNNSLTCFSASASFSGPSRWGGYWMGRVPSSTGILYISSKLSARHPHPQYWTPYFISNLATFLAWLGYSQPPLAVLYTFVRCSKTWFPSVSWAKLTSAASPEARNWKLSTCFSSISVKMSIMVPAFSLIGRPMRFRLLATILPWAPELFRLLAIDKPSACPSITLRRQKFLVVTQQGTTISVWGRGLLTYE